MLHFFLFSLLSHSIKRSYRRGRNRIPHLSLSIPSNDCREPWLRWPHEPWLWFKQLVSRSTIWLLAPSSSLLFLAIKQSHWTIHDKSPAPLSPLPLSTTGSPEFDNSWALTIPLTQIVQLAIPLSSSFVPSFFSSRTSLSSLK